MDFCSKEYLFDNSICSVFNPTIPDLWLIVYSRVIFPVAGYSLTKKVLKSIVQTSWHFFDPVQCGIILTWPYCARYRSKDFFPCSPDTVWVFNQCISFSLEFNTIKSAPHLTGAWKCTVKYLWFLKIMIKKTT